MNVTAQIVIKNHSIRNLDSLDKGIRFTAEFVDDEELKLKLAQWLLFLPSDQVLRVTFEPVEN